MTKQNFKKGIDEISASFGNLIITKEKLDIWFKFLCDIDDKEFEKAVRIICNETKELYSGTNIVALIREQIYVDDGIKLL